MSSPNDEPKLEPIIVPMWGVESAQGEATLETCKLGPCVGIAIYEPNSQTGFMAHIPNPELPGSVYEVLENRLITNFKEEADFVRMKAWLGGAKALGVEQAHIDRVRQWVVDALLDMGLLHESIYAQWLGDDHLSGGMRLDCSNGNLEYFYED